MKNQQFKKLLHIQRLLQNFLEEREGSTPILLAVTGTNVNEEASNSERNCYLGELPRQNENVIRENI